METVGWIHWENHKYCNTLSRRHGNHQQWLNGWNKQKKCGYWTKHETARIVSRQTSQRHQNTPRRTRRRVDGHSQTDGHRDGRTGGGRGDERRSNHRRRREIGVKAERNSERVKEGEEWGGGGGETAKRNHAWFTFDLSKGHGLPCGARARVRPLWAEQGVLIVLLVRVVGVVLRHRNWDGGGEELAPLPRILEAAERPRLLLIPYIYKQDRHKEKNCREIWAHKLKERKKWRR